MIKVIKHANMNLCAICTNSAVKRCDDALVPTRLYI